MIKNWACCAVVGSTYLCYQFGTRSTLARSAYVHAQSVRNNIRVGERSLLSPPLLVYLNWCEPVETHHWCDQPAFMAPAPSLHWALSTSLPTSFHWPHWCWLASSSMVWGLCQLCMQSLHHFPLQSICHMWIPWSSSTFGKAAFTSKCRQASYHLVSVVVRRIF